MICDHNKKQILIRTYVPVASLDPDQLVVVVEVASSGNGNVSSNGGGKEKRREGELLNYSNTEVLNYSNTQLLIY